MVIIPATMETIVKLSQKPENRTIIWFRSIISACVPERIKVNHRHPCTFIFVMALFPISRLRHQPRHPPTNEWVKNVWYIESSIQPWRKMKFCIGKWVDHMLNEICYLTMANTKLSLICTICGGQKAMKEELFRIWKDKWYACGGG